MNEGYSVKYRKHSDESIRLPPLRLPFAPSLWQRLRHPSLAVRGAGLMVAISFVAVVFLYRKNQAVFLKLQTTLMDPIDEFYPFSDSPIDFTARHVIFYGDSRAKQWPNTNGVEGVQFWNRGIGGHSSKQALLRWEAHMRPLLNRLPTHSKPIVVLQLGVNDLKNVALFPQRDVLQHTQQNLRKLIALASLDCDVVVSTVFPTGHCPLFTFHRLVWQHYPVAKAIEATNVMLRDVARTHGLKLLDAAKLLATMDATTVDNIYQNDLLHLNPAGYSLLNQNLALLLEELLAK